MKDGKRRVSDEELDALLSGSPLRPEDGFVERTVIKAAPATDLELDTLLSGDLVTIRADFTERTLAGIEKITRGNPTQFSATQWLVRSGMVAAVLLVGLFSYSIWQNHSPAPTPTQIAKADLAGMGLEELLYLEETLSSAKVLIELEKTVPLYYLIDEADS